MVPAPGVAMRHNAVSTTVDERNHPMQMTTIGLDLAKNTFQVHGVTAVLPPYTCTGYFEFFYEKGEVLLWQGSVLTTKTY